MFFDEFALFFLILSLLLFLLLLLFNLIVIFIGDTDFRWQKPGPLLVLVIDVNIPNPEVTPSA